MSPIWVMGVISGAFLIVCSIAAVLMGGIPFVSLVGIIVGIVVIAGSLPQGSLI